MTFRGLKVATKDIDLVVVRSDDMTALLRSMEVAGFTRVPRPGKEYRKLGARVIMENADGMRFDLFERVVSRKLAFSSRMERRSKDEAIFGRLVLRLASAEDIFLFKSVTDRPDDLDDMSVLATGGLDWNVIKAECLAQESGQNWASHLVGKLQDLEEQYDIVAPVTSELQELAEVYAMGNIVSAFLEGREKDFEAIRDHLRAKYQFTVEEITEDLSRLVKHGILALRERGGKRYYRRPSQRLGQS